MRQQRVWLMLQAYPGPMPCFMIHNKRRPFDDGDGSSRKGIMPAVDRNGHQSSIIGHINMQTRDNGNGLAYYASTYSKTSDWHGEYDTIIDVRSPSEFADDHIPGAINLPVLSDEERVEVGIIYKQSSPFAARKIGAALIIAHSQSSGSAIRSISI